jgi:hypothetical protein
VHDEQLIHAHQFQHSGHCPLRTGQGSGSETAQVGQGPSEA